MNDLDNLQTGPQPLRRYCMPAVVATVALLIYAPSWSHPFVYDDVTAVRDHPLVRGDNPLRGGGSSDGDSDADHSSPRQTRRTGGNEAEGWLAVLRSPYWPVEVSPDPLYRPLTIASFRLDHELFDGQAAGFHVVNSVLHACVSVLLALVAQRLWNSRGWAVAGWFAGLLFAVHPACTEAVVPIVGRSELLALFFILLMVYVHLGRAHVGRRSSVGHHLTLTLLYALACGSKEHGVLAVFVIAAIDWRNRPLTGATSVNYRVWVRDLVSSHYLGMILVLCALFTMRWYLFGSHTSLPLSMVDTLLYPLAGADTGTRLASAFALCALAFQLMFCAGRFCPIWGIGGFDLPASMGRLDVIVGVGIATAVIAALWFSRSARRSAAGAFIPLIGLVVFLMLPCHFVPGANWLFAERWLYTPLAMLLLAGSAITRIAPRGAVAALVIVTPMLALVSVRYQRCWRSDEALMTAAVERQPNNAVALAGLCAIYDRNEDMEKAAVFVDRLVRRHPGAARTWYYQTRLFIAQDRYAEAGEALERFVAVAGVRATLRNTRGMRREIEQGLRRGPP